MASHKLSLIPDLLEEHFHELIFHWGQRNSALFSPLWSFLAFLDLDRRIQARIDALLLDGEETALLRGEALVTDDAQVCFAAAYVLLRSKNAAAASIVSEAFRQSQEEQLQGIRQALCHGPTDLI